MTENEGPCINSESNAVKNNWEEELAERYFHDLDMNCQKHFKCSSCKKEYKTKMGRDRHEKNKHGLISQPALHCLDLKSYHTTGSKKVI